MNLLKKIFKHPNFLPLFVVLVFGVLAGKGLIGSGYFNMHDDLQMMRQLEMEKCFLSFQIPCRWVPDMGYGFGYPLFNFYPPLPYLVGEIFRATGISFVDTAKDLFILSFVASGITMYFLSREFFGRFGGVVSSVFYVWAPYHSVDTYVRGAMNESWALIFFPLILWTSYKLITSKSKLFPWAVGLSLGFFGLLTSHNIMAMIFSPLFVIWCLVWMARSGFLKRIPQLIFSGIFALGLAAFFTIPVLAEQKLVQTNTLIQGYYEYTAHFVTFSQLLVSRFWGYGPSVWGFNDGLSFQIGHIHWILSLIVGAIAVYLIIFKRRKIDKVLLSVPLMIGFGWFAAFMTHSKSTFIWTHISPLAFVQFPWRFLTIVILCFSFAAGAIVVLIPSKVVYWTGGVLVAALIALNWNYFTVQGGHLGALTDEEKFSGVAWDLQQTAGIYDYLPKYAVTAPKEPQAGEGLAQVMNGSVKVTRAYQITNYASFNANVASDSSEVRIGILKFDGWKAYIDGRETQISIPDEEKWGRIWINLPKGEHKVELRFTKTPARAAADAISFISWIALPALIIWRKRLLFLA